jgi:hypothetical protein
MSSCHKKFPGFIANEITQDEEEDIKNTIK